MELMDPRYLNKPDKFKNAVEHWKSWKFAMVNFLSLTHASFPDVLEQA